MVRVAEEWLATCGGCEVTILDIEEALLDLLPSLQFVHMPVIMEHKFCGQMGEKSFEIPESDVGLITGGVRNEENARVAQEMRKECKVLVAVGSCANFGGIPALANMYTVADMMYTVYRKSKGTEPADNPSTDIPALKDRLYALNEVVKVDIGLPGCPSTLDLVAEALTALITNKPFKLVERSVCDECLTKREKKAVATLKRPLDIEGIGHGYSEMRCLVEQRISVPGPGK